ncbi:MAG: hypothetical protein AVDCRST_MAG93-1084 [uncultured Chloroflexia bacterium]|uniref:Uncharacterized protein n=1 Tax=uncultured Chloroflexia bacterium TaxID=1672391 RepID=A0A6J4HXI2_9CHLR|nr:MAG: hypothetical protein AVDCRST_MAG93-1084 [uncultured Chloroflexia bacterium]
MEMVRGPARTPGLFYTNCYTNTLGAGLFYRGGSLVSHVGKHIRISVQRYRYGGVS